MNKHKFTPISNICHPFNQLISPSELTLSTVSSVRLKQLPSIQTPVLKHQYEPTESSPFIDHLVHKQVALPYNASVTASETLVCAGPEMLRQAIHDPLHHLSDADNTLWKIHHRWPATTFSSQPAQASAKIKMSHFFSLSDWLDGRWSWLWWKFVRSGNCGEGSMKSYCTRIIYCKSVLLYFWRRLIWQHCSNFSPKH